MRRSEPSWMNDDLRALQAAVRQFLAQEFVPHRERWIEQGMVDRDAWNKAGEMGLLCASIPEEYGGAGGTFAHDAVITQELVRAGVRDFSNGVHSNIVANYVLAYGTAEQKRAWLPQMASGQRVGAIAMTEPGAGSDLGGIVTRATRDRDCYVLDGSKMFITNGMHANLICVAAKTAPGLAHKGISLIMIETEDLAGFSRGPLLNKLGMKAADTTELFFEDVRVPAANLLGTEENQGFAQLMQQLPRERTLLAVQAVAAMELAVELTARYVKERKAFGKRLIDLQNTRFKLAECMTETRIARVFVDDCVQKFLSGALDTTTAAMAKWWTTQKQCEVVDECMQHFGGYGYMLEYPIARMYADARVQRIYGGSNEVMKELVARDL